MKIFYQKFVEIDYLIEELHDLELSSGERHHLATLLDSSLYHAILDEILSNLSEDDKKLFLNKLNEDPENEELMEFLKGKVEDIEERIKKVSKQVINEMHEDVKEAKRVR